MIRICTSMNSNNYHLKALISGGNTYGAKKQLPTSDFLLNWRQNL
jgi:hypothetical protein